MGGRHPPDFVEEWSRVIKIGLKPTVCPYILNPNAYSAHKMAVRVLGPGHWQEVHVVQKGARAQASGRDM